MRHALLNLLCSDYAYTHACLSIGMTPQCQLTYALLSPTLHPQPILGFFRPKLKSKWRPVFYVIHAIVIGYVLELLGGTAPHP